MHIEVIDDILEVEDKAEKIILEAQNKSRDILQQSQEKAQKLIKEAIDKEREEGEESLKSLNETMLTHLSDYEKEQQEILNQSNHIDNSKITMATDKIIARLCKTDIFGDI